MRIWIRHFPHIFLLKMLKFSLCILIVISTTWARRFHRQTDGQQTLAPARPPPPPNPPSPPPFILEATTEIVPPQFQQQPLGQPPRFPVAGLQIPQQQFQPPQFPTAPQIPQQQPLGVQPQFVPPQFLPSQLQAGLQIPPQQLPSQFQPTLALQNGQSLLQFPQQPLEKKSDEPTRRHFAPGFEERPIPVDPGLNQPKIQWFGDPLQGQDALAVLRPQQQQLQGKQQELSQLQQQLLNANVPLDQLELRQRILTALNSQINNAGRDREAFLARINVTGDPTAGQDFVKSLKNMTSILDKQPFISVELMKDLVNAEIQLAVDNWIINEEVAAQIAATFSIPRETAHMVGFSLTAADVDEMHIAGNNPTASKKFLVQLRELVWRKIDQQYRITTDLLATLSDAFLNLLVGNGIVKEKFGDDIAAYFYRSNNRKIRLF